jgi:hypothetical protein
MPSVDAAAASFFLVTFCIPNILRAGAVARGGVGKRERGGVGKRERGDVGTAGDD